MSLKIAVIILFFAVIVSLSSGLTFLLKDMQVAESKRTLYALGIRVSLAASLLALIAYGVASGKFASTAPWDRLPEQPGQVQQEN